MQLVLFDLDGTLVDSSAVIIASQTRTFEAHGLPVPSREAMFAVVGLSLPLAMQAHVGPDGPYAAMAETYRAIYHDIRTWPEFHDPLFAGAAETLDRLGGRDDVLLGIATGKGRRGVANIADREGWAGRFVTIQTADDGPSKPAPDMIINAARAAGVSPRDVLMIGDSVHDIEMARAAGAFGIGVSWGFMPVEALRAAGAGAIISDFPALDGLLDREHPLRQAAGGPAA